MTQALQQHILIKIPKLGKIGPQVQQIILHYSLGRLGQQMLVNIGKERAPM